MRTLVLIVAVLLLASCASSPAAEPEPKVVTVTVPVKEPCIEDPPERPEFSYGKGPWPGDREAARLLADDFERAYRWGIAWEAAAVGCIKQATPQ